MANFKTIITLAFIATSSAAQADDYPDYQAQQQQSIEQFQQGTEMQNMQDQINSQIPPQQIYQQPQVVYQPQIDNYAAAVHYYGNDGFQ